MNESSEGKIRVPPGLFGNLFGARTLSEMASIMGRKGAKKGAKKAGKARMKAMSPEQRSELASLAARARWAKVKAAKVTT